MSNGIAGIVGGGARNRAAHQSGDAE